MDLGYPSKYRQADHIVRFSLDGRFIVTKSRESIAVWDVAAGKEIAKIVAKFECHYHSVAISPDGSTVLLADYENVKKWDIQSGKTMCFDIHDECEVTSVSFSQDGQSVLASTSGGLVQLFDISTGSIIRGIQCKDTVVIWQAIFDLDENSALLVYDNFDDIEDYGIYRWDFNDGSLNLIQPFWREGVVLAKYDPIWVELSPGGKYAVTIIEDELGFLIENGHNVLTFWGDIASFSADGRYFVVKNGITLQLYEVNAIFREYKQYECEDNINAFAFSSDGKYLVAKCEDSSLIIWDCNPEPRRILSNTLE